MRGSTSRRLFVGLCLLGTLTGCAAFHPMEGVPARYLPTELKAGERNGKKTIDFSLLSQKPPVNYLIDSGDVLAVYVEGQVGRSTDPPPVHFPLNNEGPASFGLPFPVREDGTISLPNVGSIFVRGQSIAQVEQRVKQAYLSPKQIIHPENYRVQVSLQRPRQYRVLVIRQDSRTEPLTNSAAGGLNLGLVKRGSGKLVSLPAYSNDVLNALTATDGMPGLDAEPAVYVIRRRGPRTGGSLDSHWPTDLNPSLLLQQEAQRKGPVVRGQSPGAGAQYWRSSPLNEDGSLNVNMPRSNAGGVSYHNGSRGPSVLFPGSLHDPMRLPESRFSVEQFDQSQNHPAYVGRSPMRVSEVGYSVEQGEVDQRDVRQAVVRQTEEAPVTRPRSVAQAHWTGQGDALRAALSSIDATRDPAKMSDYEQGSRVEQAAAWNEPRRTNRHGIPFTDAAAESRAVQLMNHEAWSSQRVSRQPALQGQAADQPTQLLPQPSFVPNQAQGYGDQPQSGDPALQTIPAQQMPPQLQASPQPSSQDRPEFGNAAPAFSPDSRDAVQQRVLASPYAPQPIPSSPMGPQPGGPLDYAAPQLPPNPSWQPSSPWQPPVSGVGPDPMQNFPVEMGHSQLSNLDVDGRHVIRIPIRLGPGETADIREEDVILQDGDIVFIESRDTEVFFTGGLLGGGQFTLPRDYDLDILQALSIATSRGNAGTGRVAGGLSALNNDVSISPSTVIVLRKLPDGGEVPIKIDLYRARTDMSERIAIQPGDYILLQYTPLEAIAAFFERHLLEGALFGLAAQSFTSGN